jgi:hypothetical protein
MRNDMKMYYKNCDKACTDLKLKEKRMRKFMLKPNQQMKSMKTIALD